MPTTLVSFFVVVAAAEMALLGRLTVAVDDVEMGCSAAVAVGAAAAFFFGLNSKPLPNCSMSRRF